MANGDDEDFYFYNFSEFIILLILTVWYLVVNMDKRCQ